MLYVPRSPPPVLYFVRVCPTPKAAEPVLGQRRKDEFPAGDCAPRTLRFGASRRRRRTRKHRVSYARRRCSSSSSSSDVEVGGGVAVAGGGMCRRPSECEWRSCQRGIATHEAAQRRERVRHRPFLMWKGGGGMLLLYFEVKRNPTETLDYYIIGHTDRQAKT